MATSGSEKKSYSSKYVGDIPYLDHLNYNVWSPNAIVHLQAIKGYGLVTGEVKELEPQEDNSNRDEILSYQVLEAKVKGFLLATCSVPAKRYMAEIGSAYEMWRILKERFDSTASTKGRLAIRKQFYLTKPVGSQPLSTFISQLHSIQYQLIGTDHAIDDESLKDHLLASLPPAYNTLVEILQEREGSLSIAEVIHKVLQAEMAKSQKSGEGSASASTINHSLEGEGLLSSSLTTGPSATYRHVRPPHIRSSFRGQSRRTPYSRPFQGNCNRCNQRGHKAVSCPLGQSGASTSTPAIQNLQCFSCGEAGHGTKLCPHSSLSQSQAAKGRACFKRWLSTRKSGSGSAMAASALDELGDQPVGQPSQL